MNEFLTDGLRSLVLQNFVQAAKHCRTIFLQITQNTKYLHCLSLKISQGKIKRDWMRWRSNFQFLILLFWNERQL